MSVFCILNYLCSLFYHTKQKLSIWVFILEKMSRQQPSQLGASVGRDYFNFHLYGKSRGTVSSLVQFDFSYSSAIIIINSAFILGRGGSRAAATAKMECFVLIVNCWKPLTIITKPSILAVAATLDPSLLGLSASKSISIKA